jgi:DNA-binding response OmpR family regulator
MKLLIVDDDADILRMLSRVSQHRGHDVQTCSSPFGVSAMILREEPDVVLLDVMMPGLDGPTLAAVIAKLDLPRPPILALWSAMDDAALQKKGREAGLHTISKVTSPMQILAELERLYARRA